MQDSPEVQRDAAQSIDTFDVFESKSSNEAAFVESVRLQTEEPHPLDGRAERRRCIVRAHRREHAARVVRGVGDWGSWHTTQKKSI